MKILIVGAGPTGLTLALALAEHNIPFRIIDQSKKPVTTSNALAITPRTLEIWEELGIVDDALARGHKIDGLNLCGEKVEIGRLHLNNLPTKYPYILALPQAETEKLLTEHLSKLGKEIKRGVTFNQLTQKKDHVQVGNETYDYVIGCDGVHSMVRELSEISFKGKELPQHFIMADLHMDWNGSPHNAHAFLTSDGPIAFFPLNHDGLGRLIVDVTGENWHHKTPELKDFQNYLRKRTKIDAKISRATWISSFWIQERIAQHYRKGRVFLAGDAAHRHSPIGGQGLNTGVQDAYYLAKLFITNSDLDLYEKVRRPIGEQIVKRTTMMTKFVSTRSKIVQTFRNYILFFLLKSEKMKQKAVMTLSQLIYRN